VNHVRHVIDDLVPEGGITDRDGGQGVWRQNLGFTGGWVRPRSDHHGTVAGAAGRDNGSHVSELYRCGLRITLSDTRNDGFTRVPNLVFATRKSSPFPLSRRQGPGFL